MAPTLVKAKKLWLQFSQCTTLCIVLWFALSAIGIRDLNWMGATENSASQPYRLATQTALPSVVHLFTIRSPNSCISRLNDFNIVNLNAPCAIKEGDKNTVGSAVIVKSNGVLLTNYHVIKNKKGVFVSLDDGRNLPAKIIGSNSDTDLAVIKIEANNLPEISFGSAKDIQIGDSVLAIGNPFGLGKSVSMGIVAAMNKSKLGLNKKEDFIQTDTAVNPGDSGGALVNMRGQLIGINSAIYSQHEGSTGISFAIPLWMITQALNDLYK